MILTRLRIAGFKTFMEPAEVPIEPGLTGVVGPNGCGKSNLVEALRWVMGESSHKSMRASGMDDVIFSGSAERPARNHAEVALFIDNSDRLAPAAFNALDELQVSRRIERDAGSTYRVNGREVRARDVQLLFADAATGARSPALVRQGQIAEIIAAKPQARRRILEDAAGIAGLHARRHEAELRLKAAEDNLLRVEDVLREIDGQADNLRRQGRQAGRYRQISADIRRLEALQLAIAHSEAAGQVESVAAEARRDFAALADRQQEQTQAATADAVASHALPGLREAEAGAAAALQRLRQGLAALEAEERRVRERLVEVERQIGELERDSARHAGERRDAEAALGRLAAEEAELASEVGRSGPAREAAQGAAREAEEVLVAAEARLAALQAEAADRNARRGALERAARDENDRLARVGAEHARVLRDLASFEAGAGGAPIEPLRQEVDAADYASRQAEEAAAGDRGRLAAARAAEAAGRAPFAEAERRAQRLETEARTLSKLFARAEGDLWPRALDQIGVAKGFEVALGAALGDDLEASTNPSAPAHWALLPGEGSDPLLPEGAVALSDHAEAPPALLRRLRQVGVVPRTEGPALRARLRPGQRLVSREGDLWRWDGLTQAAEAPSPAARRLAEKNRLGDLEAEAALARAAAAGLSAQAKEREAEVRAGMEAEARSLEAARQARRLHDQARERLSLAERREAELATRRSALVEASSRLAAAVAEARLRAEAAAEALGLAAAPAPELDAGLLAARAELGEARAAATQARAGLQSLSRDDELRQRRLAAVAAETRSWQERAARAESVAADFEARLERARAEAATLRAAPDDTLTRRRRLMGEIEGAEARRREAADALSEGENAAREAARTARAALDALSVAREARARSEARSEAALARLSEVSHLIAEQLDTTPEGARDLAGLKAGAPVPDLREAETRLAAQRAERERLGGVNLRAEEELAAIEAKRDSLAGERDDLAEAIKRLRQAIGSLNREGRERLLAAFGSVNEQFRRLFTSLFGGGTAELTLIDSDDPLDAGLEILARPPGKKPQTMTLLSGGEQALTAIALIFAVFLTNPSPICVLDEVDAPLDDANVERYCDLLDAMARETATRFLVITHNPITMARMDRLFGVTMAERGVSQLVSVDLERAERLLQAV